MNLKFNNKIKALKNNSRDLVLLTDDIRNKVILDLANNIENAISEILFENHKDLLRMQPNNPMYDRLLLNEERIKNIANDVKRVATLTSPLDKELEIKIMPNGLKITKKSVPLGVVAVIYESRPNVTIDVFTLCFKSGNACILKGGKEASNTNIAFVKIIQDTLKENDIVDCVLYLQNREDTAELIVCDLVDVCIPRGGTNLIKFVRENARIPVIETGAGICHCYFDEFGDLEKGKQIINNAKMRRVSVCNSLDVLIIHKKRLGDLYELVKSMENKVEIYACPMAKVALEQYKPLFKSKEQDFKTEFLDYKMAVIVVNHIERAITHINNVGTGHSETIVTENDENANLFLKKIDAAAVYVNAPTSFTDGGQFGMGCEIGISTQKLHARGPMGLEALTSHKWEIRGNGQIRK
ncbi:MAG: glutamate-5-semialdehyde dehydrogenase [Rickettsiales bacterium]|jgi:glutamate-5-semialdehyde dehydrogenase|nr:glutamate-5-semialdehyde dehydrogenase [Rickettsiales bacterium]